MEIDKARAENDFVTKANRMHDRVHDPDKSYTMRGKICVDYVFGCDCDGVEADLDYSAFLHLKDRLLKLIDPEQDSLRFYYLENNWEKRIEHIGAKETYNPEGVIIV